MSENQIPELPVELPSEILDEILKSGLIIVAMKNHGKSDALKFLARQLMKKEDVRVFLFDPCQNFVHKFDTIPYIEMNDLTLALPDPKHMLFDVNLTNTKDRKIAMGQIALQDYEVRREVKKSTEGELPYWTFYGLEEGQNVIGRFGIFGNTGQFWLTMISEGRNFKMSFAFTGQRLADISASVIERAQGYLIGRLNGDNDVKKIRDIAGPFVAEQTKLLKQGQWIYWNGDRREAKLITFPKFEPVGKPTPLETNKSGFSIRRLFIP